MPTATWVLSQAAAGLSTTVFKALDPLNPSHPVSQTLPHPQILSDLELEAARKTAIAIFSTALQQSSHETGDPSFRLSNYKPVSGRSLNLILSGPPGSGKGTITTLLGQTLGLTPLSVSHLLRTTVDESLLVKLKTGQLLGDEQVLSMVSNHLWTLLQTHSTLPGLIYDGVPRTLFQAQALLTQIPESTTPNVAFELTVPSSELQFRVTLRRIHKPTGRTYHLWFNPPQQARRATLLDPPESVSPDQVVWLDDPTGEPLIQRPDDQIDVFRSRLKIYASQAHPIFEYYQNRIDTFSIRTSTSKLAAQRILETLCDLGFVEPLLKPPHPKPTPKTTTFKHV